MLNPFSFLFRRKSQSVVGIDIGTSSIKIVQLRKKGGRAVLETYGALSLGPYAGVEVGRATNLPIEKIAGAIVDLLRESHATTTQGGIAIPFASSLISLIEMPMVPERQLATMVPIEARKYIPVPITEVMLDWSVIPRNQFKHSEAPEDEGGDGPKDPATQKTDVLIVAIHNDTIKMYQEIVNKSGVEATFFEIEIFSAMRSVLDQEVDPVMIFDMGAATTKLYIVERGAIKSSHTINRGSQDVTSTISKSLSLPMERAETLKRTEGLSGTADQGFNNAITVTLDHIFSEANRVLLSYQKRFNMNISKVVLIGGGVAMKGFVEKAKESFQTNVVLGDPFSKIEAPAFLVDVLKNNGPEFAVALGIALRKLQDFA